MASLSKESTEGESQSSPLIINTPKRRIMRSLHSDPEDDITIEFSHHSSESLENDM